MLELLGQHVKAIYQNVEICGVIVRDPQNRVACIVPWNADIFIPLLSCTQVRVMSAMEVLTSPKPVVSGFRRIGDLINRRIIYAGSIDYGM